MIKRLVLISLLLNIFVFLSGSSCKINPNLRIEGATAVASEQESVFRVLESSGDKVSSVKWDLDPEGLQGKVTVQDGELRVRFENPLSCAAPGFAVLRATVDFSGKQISLEKQIDVNQHGVACPLVERDVPSSHSVKDIQEDASGNRWILVDSGFFVYTAQTKTWQSYLWASLNIPGLTTMEFQDFKVTQDALWVFLDNNNGDDTATFMRISLREGRFGKLRLSIAPRRNSPKFRPCQATMCVMSNSPVLMWDKVNNKVKVLEISTDAHKTAAILLVQSFFDGKLKYLYGERAGEEKPSIYVCRGDILPDLPLTPEQKRSFCKETEINFNDMFGTTRHYAWWHDSDGFLWRCSPDLVCEKTALQAKSYNDSFSTTEAFVFHYDDTSRKLTRFDEQSLEKQGSVENVQTIWAGEQTVFFLAGDDRIINKWEDQKPAPYVLSFPLELRDTKYLMSLQGQPFAVTHNKIYPFNGVGLDESPSFELSDSYSAVIWEPKMAGDSLWFHTGTELAYWKKGASTHTGVGCSLYYTAHFAVNSTTVAALCEASEAGERAHVKFFDAASGKELASWEREEDGSPQDVKKIHLDAERRLWVFQTIGLGRFERKSLYLLNTRDWQMQKRSPKTSALSGSVESFVDESGNLWMTTTTSLESYRWDEAQGDLVKTQNAAQFLPNVDDIAHLEFLPQVNGTLWVFYRRKSEEQKTYVQHLSSGKSFELPVVVDNASPFQLASLNDGSILAYVFANWLPYVYRYLP